jgi:hypothetical protein
VGVSAAVTAYLVVNYDHHCDPEYAVFGDGLKAIEAAEVALKERVRQRPYMGTEAAADALNDSMLRGGWVFHRRLSEEGDHVTVQKVVYEP